MASNINRIEEEFKEAANSWNLEKLYLDLAAAKGKALTPVEKRLLRGLLCGYSPAEIASTVYQSASSSTVRVYLSNGLYKYMEETLSCQAGSSVKIQNWSRVTQLLEKAGYRNDIFERSPSINTTIPIPNQIATSSLEPDHQRQDWGEAIDVSSFYGRTEEIRLLEQWIVTERCRLVVLLGMAGIGKTALSVKLAEQIQGQFDYVIWRSLSHAPSIEILLRQLLQVLSPQGDIASFSTIASGILQLIDSLRASRCLIVLDQIDICIGDHLLSYRPGYEGYGELIRRVANSQHQSCVMLTGREKPQGIAGWQGETISVHTFILTGLTPAASCEIIQTQGLAVDLEEEGQSLIQLYSGNPLLIKIAAATVRDLFNGRISQFLDWGTVVFGQIRELVDQQFNRLSDLEKQIMYWSLLNQGFVSLQKLQKEIAISVPQREILEAIESLQGRSLIENNSLSFRQKTVVTEYLAERLIEQAHRKVENKELALFIESQIKNYIRHTNPEALQRTGKMPG